ncbi:MAG: RNA polymerase sigma factor [Desulfatibacillaceae bacterium]|nr:RNA polymerase sigma factor [Desulfatibacillaceae bacterium]
MASFKRNSFDAGPDAELVEKARRGDRSAFERLVQIYSERIFAMIYARVRNVQDAQDLTQEVFIRAYKNMAKLQEAEKFVPWLFSIARNRVTDFKRKKRFLFFLGSPDDVLPEVGRSDEEAGGQTALDGLLSREFWSHVDAFSAKLSTGEKEVFFLRFLDQLKIPEIAQVLNKSQSTVKTLLYRAVAKFESDRRLSEYIRKEEVS